MSEGVASDLDRESKPVVMLFDGWDFIPVDLSAAARKPVAAAEPAPEKLEASGVSR